MYDVLAAFFSAYVLFHLLRWYRLRKAMPPGPLGIPFIGNTHQMARSKPWLKFDHWSVEYGPVASVLFGSKPVIVLSTAKAAWDLLEKRSDIYSGRPRVIMAGEILSDNKRGLMMSANDLFRKWRKMLHAGLHSRAVKTYNFNQDLESILLMKDLLDDPKSYMRHFQRFAASIMVSVSYGRRVESVDEWVVRENISSLEYMFRINVPGQHIVESMPWLLHLPKSWQWFRKGPEEQRQKDIKLYSHLYNEVKGKIQNGTARDCLSKQAILNFDKIGMNEIDLAYGVSSPFGAGIETTVGTLMTLMFVFLRYPQIQKKAQEEIDTIIGRDRLPNFNDKPYLPYLDAVLKELMRWRPVAILGGMPHASTADDVYEGMFIPKGATVFANLYSIMKDPELFPDPTAFKPERFLETENPRLKDFDLPFGFGRRECPGIHLARNSVYINSAKLIWSFDILPALDSKGNAVLPDPDNWTEGAAVRPVEFECRIVTRDHGVKSTIISEWEVAKPQLEQL